MNRRNFIGTLGLALLSLPVLSKLKHRKPSIAVMNGADMEALRRLHESYYAGTQWSRDGWTSFGPPPSPGDTVYINEGSFKVGDRVCAFAKGTIVASGPPPV